MSLHSNNYTHITALGTYILNTKLCSLETIKINTAGGSSNTITVTEGNSAKVIAVIDGTAIHKHNFDLTNLVGLRLVVATGTCPDITVIWQ